MAIKLEPTYTEFEVAKILKDSEGERVAADDANAGHAESRHELKSAGRGRENVTINELLDRLAFEENLNTASAFNDCQAKAVAFALNRKGGQTALGWLCFRTALSVFVLIDITAGNFPMVVVSGEHTVAPPSGARFVVAPTGRTFLGMPAPQRTTAQYIGMKLMKQETARDRFLHIRTAFPLAQARPGQTARINYVGGHSLVQTLPV
jgi:hypothetical protein